MQREPGGRYQIHELLRQFGQQQLEQDSEAEREAHNTHSLHYLELLAEVSDEMSFHPVPAAIAELDNIRRAWRWAAQEGFTEALYGALHSFIWISEYLGLAHELRPLLYWTVDQLTSKGDALNDVLSANLRVRIAWVESDFTESALFFRVRT